MVTKRELAPDAISVECLPEYRLRVAFANGEVRVFDAKAQLLHRKCYALLKTPSLYNKAHIDNGTVVWTDEIDIDPEWLYEASEAL